MRTVSGKRGSCSIVACRKSSVCSWSYHTAIWRKSSAFQPGDSDIKLTSRLVPEPSFLSVSNPPPSSVFSYAPINLQTVSTLNVVDHNLTQTCMHARLSSRVRWLELGELGNGYLQTLALSSARDLTKCEAHRVSGITAALGVGFLTAVLSPRTLSPSLPVHLGCFMRLALRLGSNPKHLTH